MNAVFEYIRRGKMLWIIIIPLFLFVIFLILTFSSFIGRSNNSAKLSEPTPITTDAIYKKGALEREIERLSQKKKLTMTDEKTKSYLMNFLGGKSGVLDETKNYKMEYVSSLDNIEVEIFTQNIKAAKEEALSWLGNIPGSGGLGLSSAGICNFPVVFYLNFDVKNSLPQEAVFDPNPTGCN